MAAYKMAAVKVTPPNDFPLGLIRSNMVFIHLFLMLCDLQKVVRDLCPILYSLGPSTNWQCPKKNLLHNKIDGYSVLSQEIQTMKALKIIARWDRHRPHHSLILVRNEIYWFMRQNGKNRIMISYAHITLILIMPTPKHVARALHVNYLFHQEWSILEWSNQATKYQSNRVTELPINFPTPNLLLSSLSLKFRMIT